MTDTTFPSSGERITKAHLRRAFKKTSGAQDYVLTGFNVSIGTGLAVNIAAGEAFGNGTFIKRDVATNGVAVAANQTALKVWVGYDDAQRNVVLFTTGTAPGENYVLLAEIDSNGSAVTAVRDKRQTNALGGWGDP